MLENPRLSFVILIWKYTKEQPKQPRVINAHQNPSHFHHSNGVLVLFSNHLGSQKAKKMMAATHKENESHEIRKRAFWFRLWNQKRTKRAFWDYFKSQNQKQKIKFWVKHETGQKRHQDSGVLNLKNRWPRFEITIFFPITKNPQWIPKWKMDPLNQNQRFFWRETKKKWVEGTLSVWWTMDG